MGFPDPVDDTIYPDANAASPCGSCRQFLSEFGLETVIVLADVEGTIRKQMTLRDLLPEAFGPGQVKL